MKVLTGEDNQMLAPLYSFYEAATEDVHLSTTHISLYFALYYQWMLNKCVNPFYIKRAQIMQVAKMSSRQTFNKAMHLLHDRGYIKYIPSYNPEIDSMVCLRPL